MKLKHILLYFSLFVFPFSFLYGQQHDDHLVPLRTNPSLVNYTNQARKAHSLTWRLLSDSIVDTLPFLDDFSRGGPYPDTAFWMDNAAYINNTYPIYPPTIGVATLDGVNSQGQPYNPSCPPGASYPADSLTSRPINMSKYDKYGADSVWFSFYWQAGGNGLPPLTADTLLLQFRTSHTPWTTVWYQLGYSPVSPDTGFHLVMIPLLDTVYNHTYRTGTVNPYDSHFQFRFKNYACTSANADQWNIDEVYINEHRTYDDTIKNDVSFVYESSSLLKNYEYMPWEQFTCNDIRDTMYTEQRNNNNNSDNLTYSYSIPAASATYSAIDNINPGNSTTTAQTHIPIKSQYHCSTFSRPTDITMTQILHTSGDWIPWNDTLRFKQIFSNYYAYDDSTAEISYFINGASPIYLAEQITLNNADTLRGLEIYFDYMFVNPANYNMELAVWNNNNGGPGNIIFRDTNVASPRISDTLNGFTYYPYESATPLVFPGGTTIYVGWVQTNGDSLNIGFDRNTNSENKIFYWDNSFPPASWQICSFPGSIMMRPVFGTTHFHSPSLATTDIKTPLETISLYPNPAKNMVTLSSSVPANTMLKIMGADGREYVSNNNFYGNSINTSSLPSGFYIVEITPSNGQTSYQKLLIQK